MKLNSLEYSINPSGIWSFIKSGIHILIYNHANRSAKDDSHSYQVKKYYIHPQTFLCIQIGILLIPSSLLILLILRGIVVSNLRKSF